MNTSAAERRASEHETLLVTERIDRLLARHEPGKTANQEFWGAQYDLGLAWVHFPEGRGGLGVSPGLAALVTKRLLAAGAPASVQANPIGIGMAGPTLVTYGSEDQQRRYLRRCFAAEDTWCQLFSEPGAGSDLGALATTAVADGDEWVVNGQKIWTSLAERARYGLLLARTDPDAVKHRGLTYFVVDMHAPGVEIRPIRQIDGSAHFNEVFLVDVRIPDSERLGPVGEGWRTAIATLMNERFMLAGRPGTERGSGSIELALRMWRQYGHVAAVRRDRLMRLWVRAEVMRLTAGRANELREAGVPGPEGSIGKLAIAELDQSIYEFCIELMGADGMLYPSVYTSAGERGQGVNVDPQRLFLFSRQSTIAGGTSEIMRNVLGERVLGLPEEPRVDKDRPWNQTRRS